MRSGFRPDVQGLRAIAVLPVVVFHTFPSLSPGGYVGVDIFFVISGFLITSIIYREIEARAFSLVDFYDRRLRRILPALLAVLVFTTVASVVVLLPSELERYGRSLLYTGFFASNIFFMRISGYFGPVAEESPLLHLWSLAVEEQFYIVLPIILFVALRFVRSKTMLGCLLLAVALLSLGLSEWALRKSPWLAFYSLPTRWWELGVGGLLGIGFAPKIGRRTTDALGILGIALIAGAIISYDANTPFPGLRALAPCLGAAFVIMAGPDTLAGRALSARPLVAIGDISYSLYLWHWPIAVFTRLCLQRPLGIGEALLVILASAVAAFATYVWVETPMKRLAKPRMSLRVVFGICSLVLAAVAGAVLIGTQGWPQRVEASVARIDVETGAKGALVPGCDASLWSSPGEQGCVWGAAPYRAVLVGDSHADHYAPGVAKALADAGVSVRVLTASGCTPLLSLSGQGGCDFAERAFDEITANPDVRLVILAGFWTAHDETLRAKKAAALQDLVTRYLKTGRKVLVLGTVPNFPASPSPCYARAAMLHMKTNCADLPIAEFARQSKGVATQLSGLLTSGSVRFADPGTVLCDGVACRALLKGSPMYRDAGHLSLAGSMTVGGALVRDNLDFIRDAVGPTKPLG